MELLGIFTLFGSGAVRWADGHGGVASGPTRDSQVNDSESPFYIFPFPAVNRFLPSNNCLSGLSLAGRLFPTVPRNIRLDRYAARRVTSVPVVLVLVLAT